MENNRVILKSLLLFDFLNNFHTKLALAGNKVMTAMRPPGRRNCPSPTPNVPWGTRLLEPRGGAASRQNDAQGAEPESNQETALTLHDAYRAPVSAELFLPSFLNRTFYCHFLSMHLHLQWGGMKRLGRHLDFLVHRSPDHDGPQRNLMDRTVYHLELGLWG